MDWLLDNGSYEEQEEARAGLEPGVSASVPLLASRPGILEMVGWAMTGLLAAVLRLGALGLRPLGEGEAEQALAAFRFAHGNIQAAPAGTLPALFTGNVAVFSLLGANDWTARLWPALAGVALVLLPYALRHRLGRGGALAASLLLAISPAAVWSARSLDGATLAAACGLALVTGLVLVVDGQRRGGLYLAAVGLGLGLASGPTFYTLLLALALLGLGLYLAWRLLERDWGWHALAGAYGALVEDAGLLRRAGLVAGAVLGLSATTFALHPAGVGHAADLLGAWARALLPGTGGQPALWVLLVLVRYELLIVLPALAAVLVRVRAGQEPGASQAPAGLSLTLLLAFWAAAALVLAFVAGHRTAGDLLLALVPLALLAGRWIERAWRWLQERVVWAEAWLIAGASLVLAVFFYLQVAFAARSAGGATVSVAGVEIHATTTYQILALVALVLVVALAAVAWFWRGKELLAGGAWLAALTILGLVTVKAMWGPSFSRAADPRELLVVPDTPSCVGCSGTTSTQVRLLPGELEELSLEVKGDPYTLPVTVDAGSGPVVAWYLRHWPVTSVEALPAPPETVAAVTLAQACTGQDDCDLPAIGEAFSGQGFELKRHWLPWGLRGQDLLRWLLFSEAGEPVVDQEIVLWVASRDN